MLKVFYLGLAKFNEVEVLSNSRPLTIKKVLKQHLIYYYSIIIQKFIIYEGSRTFSNVFYQPKSNWTIKKRFQNLTIRLDTL